MANNPSFSIQKFLDSQAVAAALAFDGVLALAVEVNQELGRLRFGDVEIENARPVEQPEVFMIEKLRAAKTQKDTSAIFASNATNLDPDGKFNDLVTQAGVYGAAIESVREYITGGKPIPTDPAEFREAFGDFFDASLRVKTEAMLEMGLVKKPHHIGDVRIFTAIALGRTGQDTPEELYIDQLKAGVHDGFLELIAETIARPEVPSANPNDKPAIAQDWAKKAFDAAIVATNGDIEKALGGIAVQVADINNHDYPEVAGVVKKAIGKLRGAGKADHAGIVERLMRALELLHPASEHQTEDFKPRENNESIIPYIGSGHAVERFAQLGYSDHVLKICDQVSAALIDDRNIDSMVLNLLIADKSHRGVVAELYASGAFEAMGEAFNAMGADRYYPGQFNAEVNTTQPMSLNLLKACAAELPVLLENAYAPRFPKDSNDLGIVSNDPKIMHELRAIQDANAQFLPEGVSAAQLAEELLRSAESYKRDIDEKGHDVTPPYRSMFYNALTYSGITPETLIELLHATDVRSFVEQEIAKIPQAERDEVAELKARDAQRTEGYREVVNGAIAATHAAHNETRWADNLTSANAVISVIR